MLIGLVAIHADGQANLFGLYILPFSRGTQSSGVAQWSSRRVGNVLLRSLTIATSVVLSAAPAQAEIVRAWCSLMWRDGRQQIEQGPCQFRQAFGNVPVWMGDRWVFDFPAAGQGRYYTRRNRKDFIRFERGDYILTIVQGGRPAS